MKTLLRHSAAILGATLFVVAPFTMAQNRSDVDWSITIGSPNTAPIYSPPPRVVYVQPAPVYVQPAPVYVSPRVVQVQPAPVVYYRDYTPRPVYYMEGERYRRHHQRDHRHRHND
jgi:hypothetical protein